MAPVRTERGLDRLIGFTDAAAAIAITLLILPLVDAASDIEHERLSTVLSDHLSLFVGFFVSFIVIGRLWFSHHKVFEGVAAYDVALLWLTMFWLLGIVFLPFSANVLSHIEDIEDSWVFGLYVATILCTSLCMLAIEVHLHRHPELVRDPAVLNIPGSIIFSGLLAVAMVVAVAIPRIGLFALLLLFLKAPVSKVVQSRSRSRTLAPEPDAADADASPGR